MPVFVVEFILEHLIFTMLFFHWVFLEIAGYELIHKPCCGQKSYVQDDSHRKESHRVDPEKKVTSKNDAQGNYFARKVAEYSFEGFIFFIFLDVNAESDSSNYEDGAYYAKQESVVESYRWGCVECVLKNLL